MILVYYRRKDGTIRMFHKYSGDKSIDELRIVAACYNRDRDDEEVADVVEYADDSIEAHLFEASQQRKARDKEKVSDLIDSLRSALDAAYDLEG